MKKLILIIVAAVALVAIAAVNDARASNRHRCTNGCYQSHAQYVPWHAPYYHTMYGKPVALVVPPTVFMQSHYGWGVNGTRMTPIYHQFARPYGGNVDTRGTPLRPTPRWPSDTDQFGVYYIRGPW